MILQLHKAERKKAKLRIGLSSPSGGGKTYSALILAHGLTPDWTKIALIDTENGSGELYSHLGEYNTIPLSAPFAPEQYIEAIKVCENAGIETIIIDSVSHEWDGKGGLLESNELLAQTKFKGNSWAAWSATTPRHQKFIEAITTSRCHVITTARSKTDTIQTEDKKIKKVGLKDIQREGFEYELTAAFNLDRDGHYAIASKDRTGIFIDREPFVITEETGKLFRDWAGSGVPSPEIETVSSEQIAKIKLQADALGTTKDNINEWIIKVKKRPLEQLTQLQAQEIIDALEKRVKQKAIDDQEAAKTAATLKEYEEKVEGKVDAENELDKFLGTAPTQPEPTIEPIVEEETGPAKLMKKGIKDSRDPKKSDQF